MMFYFRLAREMGEVSVSRMLKKMTSIDISCWMAFLDAEEDLRKEKDEEKRKKKEAAASAAIAAEFKAAGKAVEKRKAKKEAKAKRHGAKGKV